MGVAPDATTDDVARVVADLAGFDPPSDELTRRLLAKLVACVEDQVVPAQRTVFDRAEVGDATMACVATGVADDAWDRMARDLGVDNGFEALNGLVALTIAPQLGYAGVIELIPPAGSSFSDPEPWSRTRRH
jgi:hypothetical protein